MNKNRVKVVAAILYLGSIVVWMYGRSLESMEAMMEEPPRTWTTWDYLACAMIVSALGCTLAAIKLKDDDDDS